MDPENLKTASAYVNNLLLARGLLRNGDAIEFARPQKAKGGLEASMGQVINLVHDMVLRRDVRLYNPALCSVTPTADSMFGFAARDGSPFLSLIPSTSSSRQLVAANT